MSSDLMIQIAQTLAQMDRRLARLEVGETGGAMSGSAILTAIKTVDGAGSGLDADLLDGISSAGYLGTASASGFVGTASYTAADVLSKLLTVDGSASLLDADTVDGFHASEMGAMTPADILAKLITVDGSGSGLDADLLDGHDTNYWVTALSYTAADVLSKILTVDGTASLLDADKLDGLEGSAYSGTAHTHSEFSVAYLKSDGSTPLTGAWNAGTQAITMGSTLNVDGASTLGKSLTVDPTGVGTVTFGTVTSNTPLFQYGDFSAYGAASLWSTLAVTGHTTLGGAMTVTGTANISGTASVGALNVGGDVGIGTASPAGPFHLVHDADGEMARFEVNDGTDTALFLLYGYTSDYATNAYQADSILFYASTSVSALHIAAAKSGGAIGLVTDGVPTLATERVRITSSGMAISAGGNSFTAQGPLHVHNGTGGYGFFTKTAINAAQTIIPDGTGDVTRAITFNAVFYDSAGTAVGVQNTILNNATLATTVGTSQYTLAVSAAGAFTVSRTSGTGTATLAISCTWL